MDCRTKRWRPQIEDEAAKEEEILRVTTSQSPGIKYCVGLRGPAPTRVATIAPRVSEYLATAEVNSGRNDPSLRMASRFTRIIPASWSGLARRCPVTSHQRINPSSGSYTRPKIGTVEWRQLFA